MNRRNFLSLFSAGVAGFALDQAIPLGRVWSFPKKIVVPGLSTFNYVEHFNRALQNQAMILNELTATRPAITEDKLNSYVEAVLKDVRKHPRNIQLYQSL